jgi:hypothetical protein
MLSQALRKICSLPVLISANVRQQGIYPRAMTSRRLVGGWLRAARDFIDVCRCPRAAIPDLTTLQSKPGLHRSRPCSAGLTIYLCSTRRGTHSRTTTSRTMPDKPRVARQFSAYPLRSAADHARSREIILCGMGASAPAAGVVEGPLLSPLDVAAGPSTTPAAGLGGRAIRRNARSSLIFRAARELKGAA